MLSKIKNSLVFRIEQFMMRGPLARFSIVLFLIVFVSLMAGTVVHLIAPGFQSTTDAVWWAFLRLTDPGYLGDDEGVAKTSVSTIVTLLGYILFTGALIAILVQWLGDTMERLEQGLTPVVLNAHFVLLGYTSRTATILEEILVSQRRVERFLRQRNANHLYIALLAEHADATLMQELRLQIGDCWNFRQVILRSGSPLREDDLKRVDFAHAGAILIPASDTTESSPIDADTRTVKTLMTMSVALSKEPPEELPLVVVEVQNTQYEGTLRALYQGPMEIVAGDEFINRLMVQNVIHPGLSYVYDQFLSDVSGSQIYVREEPQLIGISIQQLVLAFSRGVLLGVVRPRGDSFEALLNPASDMLIEAGDRIAVLAPGFEYAVPSEKIKDAIELPEQVPVERHSNFRHRVLLLGWNHRVPGLLEEFASYPEHEFTIDIVSQVSAPKREKRIAIESSFKEKLEISHLEFDYTEPSLLESINPDVYDHVVLLSSERLKDGAESDARTILGYLLLQELKQAWEKDSRVLVELSDPDNIALLESRRGETIVSPLIVSHLLTRVALRRELYAVFDELFSSGGCEIFFRRIADYGLAEVVSQIEGYELQAGDYSFADLQRVAHIRGEIAIGIRRFGQESIPEGGVELNPESEKILKLHKYDELIVLTT